MSTSLHDEQEENALAASYGPLPTIAGVLFGLALIAFMFALADGFA